MPPVRPSPSAPTAGPRAGALDHAALMRLRGLELRARALVDGLARGIHVSRRHGFSVEFSEYRAYTPGDDTRFIDWKVYARTDRDYVKRYEDETNLVCTLLFDASRSMAFGSLPWTKGDYAATLAATLATVLFDQGDAVGLQRFAATLDEALPARHRPGHLRRLLLALEPPPGGARSDLAAALDGLGERLHRRGLVVIVSDFLTAAEPLERPLAALRAAGQELAIFVVLDPAERTLAFSDAARFRDLETGEVLLVDPGAGRAAYVAGLERHLAAVEAIGRRLGIPVEITPTDRPIGEALAGYLARRSARGRR